MLWVMCEHGEKGPHRVAPWHLPLSYNPFFETRKCPGGRVATIEDLKEALGGEKVDWCSAHDCLYPATRYCLIGWDKECIRVERVLIPASDTEKL